jgi:hypothetical protein
MILQTDKGLCLEVQKYGCNFRSLLAMTEVNEKKQLTVQAIQQAYDELVGNAMDQSCTVIDPDAILKWGFKALLSPFRGYQIGQIIGGNFSFWQWTKIYSILKGESTHGFHFRLGDRLGKMIFDPYPGVIIQKELSALIYRIE